MNGPTLFGVYTARFPFLDTHEDKVRPVIVVSLPQSTHKIVAIIPVSSKAKREDVDIILKDWKDEGLLKPSVARVHRLTTLLQSDLLTELGTLHDDDAQALQNSMRNFLNL